MTEKGQRKYLLWLNSSECVLSGVFGLQRAAPQRWLRDTSSNMC